MSLKRKIDVNEIKIAEFSLSFYWYKREVKRPIYTRGKGGYNKPLTESKTN